MWIALEGIDGCGKSSLIEEVCKLLPITPYHRREFKANSAYIGVAQAHLHAIMWDIGDSRDLSPKFWLYVQAAWHTLARESREVPELAISDGWYYKFLARLCSDGYNQKELLEALQFVPKPDSVVLLRVNPEVAWLRKTFRPTELGIHSSADLGVGKEAFVRYQTRTQRALDLLAAEEGWALLEVPDSEALAETAQRLAALINDQIIGPIT